MCDPARLVFVRHGETDWNVDRRMQGQLQKEPAPKLTSNGMRQAADVASFLAAKHRDACRIYCSDLKRARQVYAASLPA
jgi:2,3-bisphosphoglycerate-dependent phosphoglycerate mutase